MRFEEWFDEDPASWIVEGGRPAKCVGHWGMPTAEHDVLAGLCVMECCAVTMNPMYVMLFPFWYGTAAILSEESTVSLHHGVDADWGWRMNIYRAKVLFRDSVSLRTYVDWERLGSQTEITWRTGLNEMQHWMHGGDDGPYTGPPVMLHIFEEVADRMLCRHLTPFQQLEFSMTRGFRVVGAKTQNHYRITVGDGFELIDPESTDILVRFCLHTETWIPSSDQALALKLALEDEEMEGEVLSGAKSYPRKFFRDPTEDQKIAHKLEREWGLVGEPVAQPEAEVSAEGSREGRSAQDSEAPTVVGPS